MTMDFRALADPFPASDVEWRLQQAGEKNGKVWARVLAYITNRAIMQRLDDVCGPENWRNEYRHEANGAVMCGISIRTGWDESGTRGEWVTKWDGAENTDIEAVKGGLSSAMKRAAVQWGIGRYLYELEEGFAKVSENGSNYVGKKDGKYPAFKWDPPTLPAWALPGGSGKVERPPVRPTASTEAPAPKAATSEPSEPEPVTRDGTIRIGGRPLGDFTTDELRQIIGRKQHNPKYATLVKACRGLIADRALGNTEDDKVARMHASVAAEDDQLPFR